jgi:ubiquinone/menaquinone biosynthesis C-methylase UbiE
VTLADYYKRQFAWRSWPVILDALPPVSGQTVLDLGCGVGDLAAALATRGARVIGVDLSEEMLTAARSRDLPQAEFRIADLRALPDLGVSADGLWCSFAAACFLDFAATLASWSRHLRPGAWAAITEIDDFFGHEPLGGRAKSLLQTYAREALAAGRYDFHMGRKLRGHLERAGFAVRTEMTLADQELAFDGPASEEVAGAWRFRLDGMSLLRQHCGSEFEQVREEFLRCLSDSRHRSEAKVYCCIAVRRPAPAGTGGETIS